jgi:hypothetical protein
VQDEKRKDERAVKIDVGKIALVVVLIAGVQTTTLYHRINDLECSPLP